MHPWVIVPTHTHPPLVDVIVERADMPAVVVHTAPGLAPVDGAVNVEDLDSINIHRWWNRGMDEAEARGGDVAVLANHDIEPAPGALTALVDGLIESGATIAYPGATSSPVDTSPGGRRRITGWCFAVNMAHKLRAPEQFRWWFGDDWMDWQARTLHHGIVQVRAAVRHHNPAPNRLVGQFADMVRADQVTWWREHV